MPLLRRLSAALLPLGLALTLTSCNGSHVSPPVTGSSFQGRVFGGQQPITGATIQLWSVGTTTDGGPSSTLLTTTVTTSDGTGAANANANPGNANNTLSPGYFTITGDYTCPQGDALVFLTASGGNPGLAQGTNNAQIQNVAALGSCNNLQTNVQFLIINELTTVGAVAALYPYMTAYNAIGSTPAHASALAAAFNTASEYVNFQNGKAPGPALPAGYYASTNDLNALGNVIASCVNTTGGAYNDGSNCGRLFYLAKGAASTNPADTVTALLDIFNNPTNNVTAIFNLQSPLVPFQPTNASAPANWTLPILPVPAAPVLSPPAGTYATTQSVTISDTESSLSFFYTTDGSTPTSSSTPYTGAISVSATETISAIAVRASGATSAASSSTYTINNTLTSPTLSLSPLTTSYGATTVLYLTATSNVAGAVVTFGIAGSIGGSFSAPTCTISGTTCSVTYTPSGTLAIGTYTNDLTASFPASGAYGAAYATGTLTIETYNSTQLHAFTQATIPGTSQTDGGDNINSLSGLVQGSDGFFYGTTSAGGANSDGTVFKISADGATYIQLYAFTGAAIPGTSQTDGATPSGGLVQGTDGYLYGTTRAGASVNSGSVFRIKADGSSYTQLYAFTGATIPGTSQTDGRTPLAALVQGTDGYFYGTTNAGGAGRVGTVFRISADGSSYTQLYAFTASTIPGTSLTDGRSPYAGLVQGTDGNFYGTTYGTGSTANYGNIFRISPTGVYTDIRSGNSGIAFFRGGLVEGSDGYFYGTTLSNVFRISADGTTITVLHNFTSNAIPGTSPAQRDGTSPYASLVMGSDGNFYGTTFQGGTPTDGTVFQVNTNFLYNQIYAFTDAAIAGTSQIDGKYPQSSLVQGSDGSFYGVTETGGASAHGTLFKVAVSPTLAGPITLTVPASVAAGSTFTLGYTVSNAYSLTLQTCFATNTASDTTGWTGIKTGAATTTNATLTAPATPGTYTYTLTCGGTESGFATLTVQ